jgi:hypothetical protein
MFDLFTTNRTAFTENFRLMGGLEGGDAVDTAAVPTSYAEAFVAVVAQFKAHSKHMGWNRTQFQLYLNNKPSFHPNTGVWNLDEPVDFLDFVGNAYPTPSNSYLLTTILFSNEILYGMEY